MTTPISFDQQPLHIAHADASDASKYRRAKAQAAAAGVPLVIDPEVVVPVVHAPGTVMIPRNVAPSEYRRLKEQAIAAGKPFAFEE